MSDSNIACCMGPALSSSHNMGTTRGRQSCHRVLLHKRLHVSDSGANPGAPVSDQVKEVRELLEDGIASGEVQPLINTVFPEANAEDAFRFLSKVERTAPCATANSGICSVLMPILAFHAAGDISPGKTSEDSEFVGQQAGRLACLPAGVHIGKVMLQVADPEAEAAAANGIPATLSEEEAPIVEVSKPVERAATAEAHAIFVAEKGRSYLLVGGLGGVGLTLAIWLAQHGADHIVLSSRRHATTAPVAAALLMDRFRDEIESGVQAACVLCICPGTYECKQDICGHRHDSCLLWCAVPVCIRCMTALAVQER